MRTYTGYVPTIQIIYYTDYNLSHELSSQAP